MTKNEIEDIVTSLLEENSFEELLEKFDLTPTEVMTTLYKQGLLDEEVLVSLNDTYNY